MNQIGFCSRCGGLREDGADGLPNLPCACFVQHHAPDCTLRTIVACKVVVFTCDVPLDNGKPCGLDNCPQHTPCSCTVPADRPFICGGQIFSWGDHPKRSL